MLGNLIILALASATVSVTLGASKLFAPWRRWIAGKSTFLGDLFSCPYCLGHWTSAAFTFGYVVQRGWPVWFTVWLATTALSALVSGTITFLFTAGGEHGGSDSTEA